LANADEETAGMIIIAIRIVVLAAAAAYLVGAIYYVRKWSR
jgi:hypothetical protein